MAKRMELARFLPGIGHFACLCRPKKERLSLSIGIWGPLTVGYVCIVTQKC